MNWEEWIAYVIRETTSERIIYGLGGLLGLAFIYVMYVTWKLNAPQREQAKMDKEREKKERELCGKHIFGALEYAVKDGEVSAEVAAAVIREIGKRVLPSLSPDGKTVKDVLLEQREGIPTKVSGWLSKVKFT